MFPQCWLAFFFLFILAFMCYDGYLVVALLITNLIKQNIFSFFLFSVGGCLRKHLIMYDATTLNQLGILFLLLEMLYYTPSVYKNCIYLVYTDYRITQKLNSSIESINRLNG